MVGFFYLPKFVCNEHAEGQGRRERKEAGAGGGGGVSYLCYMNMLAHCGFRRLLSHVTERSHAVKGSVDLSLQNAFFSEPDVSRLYEVRAAVGGIS